MTWLKFNALVVVGLLLAMVLATSKVEVGKRTLVMLDDFSTKYSHSMFFGQLEKAGYELSYVIAGEENFLIESYGSWLYDHIIVFVVTTEQFNQFVDAETLVRFVDNGGNILIATSEGAAEGVLELASELGSEIDVTGTAVIDHFHFNAATDDGHHSHVVIPASSVSKDASFAVGQLSGPVLFRGVAQQIEKTPFVFPLLSASKTAYSAVPGERLEDNNVLIGQDIVLVTGIQGRNNARCVISGSLDLFSDAFFTAQVVDGSAASAPSANVEFAANLWSWVTKHRGNIRLVDFHQHGSDSLPAHTYVVKENISVSFGLEVLSENGEWVPFSTSEAIVEFTMLYPFYRIPVKEVAAGKYAVTFVAPDAHGTYSLIVEYVHHGHTFVRSLETINIRPYRHTEFERFIPMAMPYYASILSVTAALCLFSIIFLLGK
jgi:oligosaccharyltransferase complex subunit beta